MKYLLSTHAKQRLDERGIKDPNGVSVLLVKNKAKRLVEIQCEKMGFNEKGYIYFRTNEKNKNKRVCYVCVIQGRAQYFLVTAFYLDYKLLENENT